jgi:hypothetical protein
MEIWRIGKIVGKEPAETWTKRGLELSHGKTSLGHESKYWHFKVRESNPLWPELSAFLNTSQPDDSHTAIITEFNDDERLSAEWCIAYPDHSIGRAVPENKSWNPKYYAERCRNCGTGWRQIDPFRISKEPQLGANLFAALEGGFELFARPEVLEIFKQHGLAGFETWPLILDKQNVPAKSLKQIVVTEIAKPAIAAELVERERYYEADCPTCRRTWHLYYTRGMLPLRQSALKPKADFQLTHEWFGNGRAARHEVIVSQQVVKLACDKGWKGIYFVPIQAV